MAAITRVDPGLRTADIQITVGGEQPSRFAFSAMPRHPTPAATAARLHHGMLHGPWAPHGTQGVCVVRRSHFYNLIKHRIGILYSSHEWERDAAKPKGSKDGGYLVCSRSVHHAINFQPTSAQTSVQIGPLATPAQSQ